MSILGVLLTIYIVSAVIVLAFATKGTSKGMPVHESAEIIFYGLMPVVGTLVASILIFLYIFSGGKK